MAEKLMFSDIKEFKNEEFFYNHKTGKLYTDSGIYNIKIYSVNILDSNTDIAYRVSQYKNGKNTDLIKSFETSALLKNEMEISASDKFIMLTTCHGVGTPERAVLFCKLEKSENTDSINAENNSDIKRDEKVKEKEEFEKQKEIESRKIKNELSKEEYKAKKNNKKSERLEKLLFYWERLINNPRKLILYGFIFVTIVIYIILIIKKLRSKNNKGKKKNPRKRKRIEIEQRNIRRIEMLGRDNKLAVNIKRSTVNRTDENEKILEDRRQAKKGKHSK